MDANVIGNVVKVVIVIADVETALYVPTFSIRKLRTSKRVTLLTHRVCSSIPTFSIRILRTSKS